MKGWVYVITNKAMPGLIKVGYSMKDPDLRATELNHTGSPHPYVVDYEVLVEEPRDVEQTVHGRLRDRGEGKEWFRCSTEEAIAAIKSVVGTKAQIENFKRADRAKAEAIRQQKEAEEKARKEAEIRERQLQAQRIEQERLAREAEEKAKAERIEQERLAREAEKKAKADERRRKFIQNSKGILKALGILIGLVVFMQLVESNISRQSIKNANYPTTTVSNPQTKQYEQNDSISRIPKSDNNKKEITPSIKPKVITKRYLTEATTYNTPLQNHARISKTYKIANESHKIEQPLEFSDLTPNQKASMELACFEDKAKGKLFFDDCIKRKLAAINAVR